MFNSHSNFFGLYFSSLGLGFDIISIAVYVGVVVFLETNTFSPFKHARDLGDNDVGDRLAKDVA